jgi:Zn-finger nucleic acid-binding protein
MKQNIIAEITISECPGCRGIWFDHGELDAVKDEVSPDMRWLEVDTWKEQAEFKARSDPNFCPKCRDVTLTTVQDQQFATEISICTRCNGTWLAAGQFLNLINALIDEANRKSAPEIVKICLQQVKEMLTRPDSVISEWQNLKTVLELLKHRIFIQHPKLKSLKLSGCRNRYRFNAGITNDQE